MFLYILKVSKLFLYILKVLNLVINDFIYVIEDSEVCNFADDNTIYAFDDNIENILRFLKGDINNALQWFKYNQMAANPDKFQVIFMGLEKDQKLSLEINGISIRTTEEVKLLGITIDSKVAISESRGRYL